MSRLVSSGGMPSSHSALVTGLATATGRMMGVSSSAFAIAVVLASIVMYDAAGVRRAVSIQARILNQMIEGIFQGSPMAEKRLRELIGNANTSICWWVVRHWHRFACHPLIFLSAAHLNAGQYHFLTFHNSLSCDLRTTKVVFFWSLTPAKFYYKCVFVSDCNL